MTGHGGWPLNAFLTPEQQPFYAGTYFPPEPRHGMPSWKMVLRGGRRRVGEPPGRRPPPGSAARTQSLGATGAAGAVHRADPRDAPGGRRGWRCGRSSTPSTEAGAAPQVPGSLDDRAAAARAASARCRSSHVAGDGARRDLRPNRRRASPGTPSTPRGRSPTSRRCSTTTRSWPAPTCTAGRSRARSACGPCAARRSIGPCARCAAPREASTPPSTPTPKASRGSTTSGAIEELRARRWRICFELAIVRARPGRAGRLLEGRGRARGAGRDPAQAARRPARAHPSRARRQAADRVERADDLGARRGRRRARAAPTTSKRPSTCAEFLVARAARRRADGLLRTWKDGQPTRPPSWRITRSCSKRCSTLYEARFDPRWYGEAVTVADQIIARFEDPEHGGFFTTADDHEHLRRAAQGPRGLADPLRQLGGCVRSAAARAPVRRGQVRAPRARGLAPAVPARLHATQRHSGICFRRSTSTSPRCERWRSSVRPSRGGAPAHGAVAYRPHRRAGRRRSQTASRCWRAAIPSTAARRRTCASTSPARRRSPARRS